MARTPNALDLARIYTSQPLLPGQTPARQGSGGDSSFHETFLRNVAQDSFKQEHATRRALLPPEKPFVWTKRRRQRFERALYGPEGKEANPIPIPHRQWFRKLKLYIKKNPAEFPGMTIDEAVTAFMTYLETATDEESHHV